jgi:D-amino-acid oxidase
MLPDRFIFMTPRNDHILYVGGFSEPDNFDLDFDETNEFVRRAAKRAEAFLPGLDASHLDPAYPLAKGLRPARIGDCRVERELRAPKFVSRSDRHSRIVHSYGHAGSGWSFSFGCALDVMSLVDEAVWQEPPTPMKDAALDALAASSSCSARTSHAHAYGEALKTTNLKAVVTVD